ncbi:MAG: 50S ribosomal protein L25 [Candidatus Aureabacteria bacterium]|nr:50S ribosomal protein L25 [Candidatus Auribacterota bacterium]
MERLKLKAARRSEIGTRRAKRSRGKGIIPAVLYGGKVESIALSVDGKELYRVLHGKGGAHAIIDLQVEGGEKPLSNTVIVKDVQRDNLRDIILHVDFAAISLTEKLTTKVSIVETGIPLGVTQGGVLEHIIRELDIECLPADIPDRITVDVSALGIGKSLKLAEIAAPPGVRILNDPNLIAFTVSMPKEEKVEEAVPAEGEAVAVEGVPVEGEEKEGEEAKAGAKEGAKEAGKEKEPAKGKEKEPAKGKEKEPARGREKEPARGKEQAKGKEK